MGALMGVPRADLMEALLGVRRVDLMGALMVDPLEGMEEGLRKPPLQAQMVVPTEVQRVGLVEVQMDLTKLALEGKIRYLPSHQMRHRASSQVRLPLPVLGLLLQRFSWSPWSSLTTPYLAA